MDSWGRRHVTLRTLYLLFLGQLVSFAFSLMTFSASYVAELGVHAPLTLSAFTYFALAVVYGGILLYKRQKIRVAWYWYMLLGFVDVQGNFLVNSAYQFSSITSVTLLNCCTIAWSIILTWFFLGTRYSLRQLVGASLCVTGLGVVLLSDSGVAGGGGSRPFLGDILVISSTIFFSMSNVGEEFLVKKKDRIEVVCMIGVYGLLVTTVQASVLELKSFESVEWSTNLVLGFAGYAVASFMFYTLAPFVLQLSGATMFNLSLLTADLWAVVFRICFYHQQVDCLYFLALAVVVIGLVIYSITKNEKDPTPVHGLENGNNDVYYQILDHEDVPSTITSE